MQRGIRSRTKYKVYRALVLSALLYPSEPFTLYRRHIRRLTSAQLRHWRTILGISWQDHVSNVEVLDMARLSSVEDILTEFQLRWSRHVAHMDDSRLPKAVFFGELRDGKGPQGRPRLRYKDALKRHFSPRI